MAAIVTISFNQQSLATVHEAELPFELATDIAWDVGDRGLELIDGEGHSTVFDFAAVPPDEANCAALSLRISDACAFQADCLLGKDTVPSVGDFLEGKVGGLRLQPVVLPGIAAAELEAEGQGLLVRGLHYPGTVTRSNVSLLCLCDACTKTFRLFPFHCGFTQSEYFYCATGTHTLMVDSAALAQIGAGNLSLGKDHAVVEQRLPPCSTCQSPFLYFNPLRCPHCGAAYVDFARFPHMRPAETYGNVIYGNEAQHFQPE
jgi:hypothetical protein